MQAKHGTSKNQRRTHDRPGRMRDDPKDDVKCANEPKEQRPKWRIQTIGCLDAFGVSGFFVAQCRAQAHSPFKIMRRLLQCYRCSTLHPVTANRGWVCALRASAGSSITEWWRLMELISMLHPENSWRSSALRVAANPRCSA